MQPKSMWPDLKFGPINLHNVWPSKEMVELHEEIESLQCALAHRDATIEHLETVVAEQQLYIDELLGRIK